MTPAWIIAAAATGGRESVRRVVVCLAMIGSLAGPAHAQSAASAGAPVEVRTEEGIYYVAARFDVPQPPATVIEVLTDYDQIPRFLPDIKRSVVRQRSTGAAVVEQEAVSSVMVFSRRVYLTLAIQESGAAVTFTDVSGRSFSIYEGAWHVTPRGDGGSDVRYELRAKPTFSVPQFMLVRLFKRDSQDTIDRLKAEIAARGKRSTAFTAANRPPAPNTR